MVDTVRVLTGGVGTASEKPHRLGDYFADVRLLPAAVDNPSDFRVLFHRLPEAGRFWKDLMMNVLRDIRDVSGDAVIVVDYKGDRDPSAP
jgi:hypothetical protein